MERTYVATGACTLDGVERELRGVIGLADEKNAQEYAFGTLDDVLGDAPPVRNVFGTLDGTFAFFRFLPGGYERFNELFVLQKTLATPGDPHAGTYMGVVQRIPEQQYTTRGDVLRILPALVRTTQIGAPAYLTLRSGVGASSPEVEDFEAVSLTIK